MPRLLERCEAFFLPCLYKQLFNGIIIVQTVDGDDISFDKIKMESNTKIKINILANGDAVIDIVSGFKVGKVVVWYKMNFIKLFKTSGDLLFDYDRDHTQKRVNLKKDILYYNFR